jgi:protein-tyrosine phosphatase
MGMADRLELGFYGPHPSGRTASRAVSPEQIAPRRGRINRLLSRLTFQSTDARLGNFHPVDSLVLRGAMPESAADFAHLKQQYNVGAIIDLRGWETSQPALIDYERHQAHQHGMGYLHLPMDSHAPPSLGQLQLFFRVAQQIRTQGQTIYIHCKQGVDRTGALVAAYEIATGTRPSEAFNRMRRYGYNWRHRLTRPAQRDFVLNPTLSTLLNKAQRGADLQKQAQTIKDAGRLTLKAYREILNDLAQEQIPDVQQRLAALTTL